MILWPYFLWCFRFSSCWIYAGFNLVLSNTTPLLLHFHFTGGIYPFIELGLGISLIRNYAPNWMLMLILGVLGITTVGVTRVLLQKKTMQCACLGSVLKLPMTEATLIENTIMLVMAATLLL